jgi:hypothetical protein
MVKTYKRETAWALLATLLVLCGFDLYHDGATRAFEWAGLFAVPIFTFVGLAFGLDVAAKQWRRSNHVPPEDFGQ